MTVKEYLQQAYYLDRKINVKKERLARMRAALYCKSPGFKNNGGKGSNYGSFEGAANNAIVLEERINLEIAELEAKRAGIENFISRFDDPIGQEILERRYLFYQKWGEIAAAMNYDERYIFDLHSRALKKITVNRSKSQ